MGRFQHSRCGFVAGAAMVLAMTSAVCSADTINFSFTGGVGTTSAGVSSLTFTGSPPVPPLSVLVSATQGGNVTRDASTGLGVSGGSGGAFEVGNNETLLFDFSPNSVVVNNITFTQVDLQGNDDAAMIVRVTSPTATIFNGVISSVATGTVTLNLAPFASAPDRTGLSFSVGGVDGNDDFGISALTVDYTPVAAAVPLPPAVLGGAALFGCIGIGRIVRRGGRQGGRGPRRG
jgi:hypothetical protein